MFDINECLTIQKTKLTLNWLSAALYAALNERIAGLVVLEGLRRYEDPPGESIDWNVPWGVERLSTDGLFNAKGVNDEAPRIAVLSSARDDEVSILAISPKLASS